MKRIAILAMLLIALGTSAAFSAPYYFVSASGKAAWIDVAAWVGTGQYETILVVDWNVYSGPYQHESHAFGFRWDGTAYVSDMLNAFHNAGIFTVTTGYGGAFLMNIVYNDSVDYHTHADEEGSWGLASTTDPYAQWGPISDDWTKFGEWDANTGGMNVELLMHGQIEGINAVKWFGGDPNAYFLDVPFVVIPEPSSILAMIGGLASMGGLALRRRIS